jgi:hypothetical protein
MEMNEGRIVEANACEGCPRPSHKLGLRFCFIIHLSQDKSILYVLIIQCLHISIHKNLKSSQCCRIALIQYFSLVAAFFFLER